MCRFTAYCGPEIPLERIVVLPKHSLLEQSQNATEAKLAVNGDGFGIAWYGDDAQAGLYRDVLPAWSDGNLTDLCRMVKSRLFLAHVRASTTGETSRANCHPFRVGRWSFMHNGQIGDFKRIHRKMAEHLPDPLYEARRGTTDSELLFLTLLANGLSEDPHGAMKATLAQIRALQGDLRQPNRITCAFSDGTKIYAMRHSSDGKSPTLYLNNSTSSGGHVLASEPLDDDTALWNAIGDGEFVELDSQNGAEIVLAA